MASRQLLGVLAGRALLHLPLLLACSCACANTATAARPNIVFVLADDLGYNNIGHRNHITKTPNIDALFERGLTLNFSYSHKWCAPTRSALMTGRLPYHTGIEHGDLGAYAAPEQYLALSQNFSFMPATLKSAGYSTHMLGKWNLGFWAERYTPIGRGFDSYLGYLSADEQYYTHYKWPPYSSGTGVANYSAHLPSLYNIEDLLNNTGPASTEYDGVYSTYMYAAEARRIIAGAAQQPDPLFLYLAAQSIHTPLEAPDVYMDMYRDAPGAANHSDAQIIHAMVTALDDLVGNVTGALKDAGLWQNTLLVFTADNGGDTHGNNHPLRGGKFTTWDGGLRVNGAVSGGFLPAACSGRTANGLVHVADWHPTFAALAGATINASGPRPLDGVNVWPHLESCGAEPSARTELLHHYDGPNQGAFRVGDLKLIIGGYGPWCWDADYPLEGNKTCKPGRGDPHPIDWHCTPCIDEGPPPCSASAPCLFNMTSDPEERHNLATQLPGVVASMRARYNVLGADACTPAIGDCLDYIGLSDQVRWVNLTVNSMHIQPLPGAGTPLPPPPPPPPAPPIPPAQLNGTYEADGAEFGALLVHPDLSIELIPLSGHVCWSDGKALGTVSANGTFLNVTARGSACLRYATGEARIDAAHHLSIQWKCLKPAGPPQQSGGLEPCSWPTWSKPAPGDALQAWV